MPHVPNSLNSMNEKLKLLRLIKGYSQRGIAHKLHITQQAYSKIENCKIRLNNQLLNKILIAMNCTMKDIQEIESLYFPK